MDNSEGGGSSSTHQRGVRHLRNPPFFSVLPPAEKNETNNGGMENGTEGDVAATDASEDAEMNSTNAENENGHGIDSEDTADDMDMSAKTSEEDNEMKDYIDRPRPLDRESTDGTGLSSLSMGDDDEESNRRKLVSPLSMTSGRSRVVSPVSSNGDLIPSLPEPEAEPIVDDTEPYYGGVYYGEDDDDGDGSNDLEANNNQGPPSLLGLAAKDDSPPVDPEVPVYGGVYYGSDEERASAVNGSRTGSNSRNSGGLKEQVASQKAKKPSKKSSRRREDEAEEEGGLIPPSMEYFAGIQMPRKPSFTSTLTGSYNESEPSASVAASLSASMPGGVPEHMYDGGEDWSINSRDSRKSATSRDTLLSADEREWQRRLRDDLLHPVTEDAVIGDAAIDLGLNNASNAASGFTGLSGISRGTGPGSKSSRSRRKKF